VLWILVRALSGREDAAAKRPPEPAFTHPKAARLRLSCGDFFLLDNGRAICEDLAGKRDWRPAARTTVPCSVFHPFDCPLMKFRIDFSSLFGKAVDQLFALALTQPGTFHGAARPILQGHAGGDIVKAQALALEGLHAHLHVIKRHSERFLECFDEAVSYAGLRVPVAEKWTTPVGTAAGVDPNAEGLEPLSFLYGLQMPGPIAMHPHHPAEMPFQEDSRREDLLVPPTYASQGLVPVRERLRAYREAGGAAVLLPAIVGCCRSATDDSDVLRELETMAEALAPYADGLVWLPALAGWPGVWCPQTFRRAAQAMSAAAPGRLLLAEMPAFESSGERTWLDLVGAFADGGGAGIVAVGGREVPREQTPNPARWPFETAIQCGASLAAYRQTAIEAARRAFPSLFIAACGGFHRREEAFQACEYANVIVENEAYTRYGPGIALQLLHKLVLRLRFLHRAGQIGSEELWGFQQSRWQRGSDAPSQSMPA